MKLNHCLHAVLVLVSCVLTNISKAVTVPISQGNSRRAYTVRSSSLLQELEDNNSNRNSEPTSSDNSYDDALTSANNNSTLFTAEIMSHVIRDGGNDYHNTINYLGHVRNPALVADELETAVKYLTHQAELGKEKGVNADGSADMTRVLDGFVFLNNLYDSLVRPGSGAQATVVSVDTIISPWFNVNEQRNEMTVTFTLVQNWTDKRLAYRSRLRHPEKFSFVTLTSYMNSVEIWMPQTYVVNEKRSFNHDVTPVRITPYGAVSREQRMSVTVNCPFYNNEMFPFDSPKCSLDLASFYEQVRYKWGKSSSLENFRLVESSGFRIKRVLKLNGNFSSDDGPLKRSGLRLEFHLERKLFPYVTKLYLPLGCFCLISIAGLISNIGPEIGAGLSYFMFGLMTIFMAISFNGADFNWGYGTSRLDSYYVLCVFTVFITGLVNMFRLKRSMKSSNSTCLHMSTFHETQAEDDNSRKNMHQNFNNGSSSNNGTRLWRDSDNFIDDDDEEGGGSVQQAKQSNRCIKAVKRSFRRILRSMESCCLRINDFSLAIMIVLFISWNSYYWITNLSKQD